MSLRIVLKMYLPIEGKHRDYEDTKGGRCLKNYFQDIMLIIVYHYPFYATIPFVMSNYKDAFPNIVVCGTQKSARYNILVVDMNPRGYLTHECLGEVIRSYPGFRGYMLVNDDMIVNWWNFVKLDKDKIWQGAEVAYKNGVVVGQRPIPDDWFWQLKENGARSCERAYREVVKLKNDPSVGIDIPKLLAIHFLNGRNKTMCFRTWSDFVYIPGKYSREFELLCGIFYRNKVFLEIAFPTITSFLEPWRAWEKVYGVYLPDIYGFTDFTLLKNVWPKYSKKIPFLHPIKIFGRRGLNNRRELEKQVLSYGKQFLHC